MDLYSEEFFEHGKNPQNTGKLGVATHKAEEVNTSCGDRIRMELRVENGELRAIRHETEGCLVTKASASILSEKLVGKTVEQVRKMTAEDLLELLKIKLTPGRVPCAVLPLAAIKKALKN